MSKTNQDVSHQSGQIDAIELGAASVETHGIMDGEETLGGDAPAGISEE